MCRTQRGRRLHTDDAVNAALVSHSVGWAAHGATVPRNGEPLCRGHNLLKERGCGVRRDADGVWHFTHPDGTAFI